ncbi:MAG: prepilin-type N-terminal cleavage/methylation domain-containing protein [Proteobacteria bacterium]|nr:prepilin-type N-terminal cleavage/methylation domain-containing protein [Pseudomonadota bacterium]
MASNFFSYHSDPTASEHYQRVKRGFTLVELISVIAIIAILAALAIPSYGVYIKNVRVARTIVEIRMLEQEIALYQEETGHLPNSLGDIGRDGFMDPWGHPYKYLNIADGGIKGNGELRRDKAINPLNSDYDLFSMGENGVFKKQLDNKDSLDDIVRARDGAFIDLAEKF